MRRLFILPIVSGMVSPLAIAVLGAALFTGSDAACRAEGQTAASKYNWTNQTQGDHFDNVTLSQRWNAYDGPGHVGNGIRSPDAIAIKDSVLTITGTSDGVTGGMSWTNGQLYGRWEARARYTAGTSAYHCVMLLWPDALDWPEGGEIDFSEVGNGDRQTLHFFLHYSKDNKQHHNSTEVDMTTWHNYAVEWTESHVLGFINGEEFFRSEDTKVIPKRPMHATIQLDWFPDNGERGPGKMEVDWIRQYGL